MEDWLAGGGGVVLLSALWAWLRRRRRRFGRLHARVHWSFRSPDFSDPPPSEPEPSLGPGDDAEDEETPPRGRRRS